MELISRAGDEPQGVLISPMAIARRSQHSIGSLRWGLDVDNSELDAGVSTAEFDIVKYAGERALVEGLKSGDQQAFRQAVARYSSRMLAVARSIVGTAHAEDIVQDAWVTVFRQISGFEHRSALATWLHRIVTNRAISDLRSRSKEVAPPIRPDEEDPSAEWFDDRGHWAIPPPSWGTESPEDLLSASTLQECIDKHIEAMPENQRLVVLMRDLHSESFDAICNELTLSASNVRVLLHRGRTNLIKMVNRYQETGSC